MSLNALLGLCKNDFYHLRHKSSYKAELIDKIIKMFGIHSLNFPIKSYLRDAFF